MTRKRVPFPAVLRRRVRILGSLRSLGAAWLGMLVALLFVQALLPAAAAAATGALVDAVAAPSSGTSWVWPLALLGGVLLTGQTADLFGSALRSLAARRIDGAQRTAVSELACAAPDVASLEDPAVRDDLRRASASVSGSWTESTPGEAAVAQLRLLMRVVQVATCAAVLAAFSWWLVALMLAVVLGTRGVLSRNTLAIAEVAAKGAPAARRERYWRDQVVAPGGAKEIRVFGLRDWVTDQWRTGFLELVEPIWHKGAELARQQWTAFAVLAVSALTGFLALGLAAMRETVSTGSLGAMLTAVIAILSLAASDHDTVVAVGGVPGTLALDRLRERLGAPAGPEPTDTVPSHDDRPPLVRFEGVGFAYPGTSRPVLDHCDLEIRPGEVLALVGSNGAGKTTLTKLLAGLYRPDRGRISVDGADLRTLPRAVWRRRIAIVFQDFVRYHLSVAENVALGAPHAGRDEARLAAAARAAGSAELIRNLPSGWDTTLSPAFSGGVDLSGGQWQHVALTRALFAMEAGARVLVLDEPTAHLDVRTELEVFRKVVRGLRNVSVVLISHRLSTVRQADRIVCLEDGRVAETGTHDELMERQGVYTRLFAEQAEDRAALCDDIGEGTTR